METASFVALSRQTALERQMDLIANNMANIATPAYKRERMVFVEVVEQLEDGTTVSYVEDHGTVRNTSEGSFTATGNPLDIAIRGEGYFEVDTPLGPRFTRSGTFTLDINGDVVTSDGYRLLDQSGQPIVVPDDAPSIEISDDGTVTAGGSSIGRIRIVRFDDEQALVKTGGGLYATDQAPQPATDAAMVQGMVEESNVQPVIEITHMIAVHRAFENSQSLILAEDDMERQIIEKLTQLSS